jgi:hypothetical protein
VALAITLAATLLPAAAQQRAANSATATRQQAVRPPRATAAEQFLAQRGFRGGQPVTSRATALRGRAASSVRATPASASTPASGTWTALGPTAVSTGNFGLVTGRVTAVAFDPSDPAGNTVYLGTTGGGVWKSTTAGAPSTSSISFSPLTDTLSALGGATDASISVGAVAVQPGGTGVVLAGTGDPNDVLDSYYGAGILRSADGGNTWTLIAETRDMEDGLDTTDYSFAGEGFAGFAWSTTNTALVVAAVSQAYEGTLVNAINTAASYEGLYYSTDGGVSWHLATITDGSGEIVQGPLQAFASPDGNAATAVVWNPIQQQFIAAVRYHGYYASSDGKTWTRLATQPGKNLAKSVGYCPHDLGMTGSKACPIFRGALAVDPETGDTFAWTVDVNNQDQGLWQAPCNLGGNGRCGSSTIAFTQQWSTTSLESNTTQGAKTIADGDYNLTLAAIPSGADTLLFAGAHDLWKCGPLATQGCTWRNTTNSTVGFCAGVGEFQHALVWPEGAWLAAGSAQQTVLEQELFLGNDSGLWRSTDAIGETGQVCNSTNAGTSSDASHFQNLNGALGSLAEPVSISRIFSAPNTILAGLGVNGAAAGVTTDWPQLLAGFGGPVAIDPSNTSNWYVNDQAGVGIYLCSNQAGCTAADFGSSPVVDSADVSYDGDDMPVPAPFLVDPIDDAKLLIGTCRLWRGPVSGNWSTANAISPILDSKASTYPCNGDGLIRSLAAFPISSTQEIVYAGMYGKYSYGGNAPGHVFSALYDASTGAAPTWSDLTFHNVTNDTLALNDYHHDISSVVIDSHDATGNTVYVTVEGIENNAQSVQTVYRSTNGGASWNNITSNLPQTPASVLAIDPQNANVVYLATDIGVYYTTNVASCVTVNANCWAPFGTGLPAAPVVALSAAPASATSPVLVAATYGRGLWQTVLYTANTGITSATVNPLSLTFPDQTVNTTSSAQTVTVTNTGSLALTPTSISISDGDFNETDTCQNQTIAAGASCSISVTFTPLTAGSLSGVMTLYANVSGGQLTVDLNGTGVAAGSGAFTLNPGSLSFGGIAVGATSAQQQVTAENSSTTTAVTITSVSVTAPFIIVGGSNSCGSSVGASSDCSLQVEFAPTAAGAIIGQLTFTDSAGTQTVTLNGTGESPPTDTLSATALNFTGTPVGQLSAAQPVTITNTGGVALAISAIAISGQFTQSNTCGTSLAGGATCAISVVFAPTTLGPLTGTLTITDALQTQTVSLTGTGTASGALTVSPSALNLYASAVGSASAAQTVTIANGTSSAIAAPTFTIAAPFGIAATTCASSLAANGACTASIVYTPTSTSAATGTLTVSDANVAKSVGVNLTGSVFNFTVAFSGSGSKIVVPGQTASYTIAISPTGTPGASATFVYACGTLPTGALCTFSPTSGNETIATGNSNNVTVSISTTAAQARLQPFIFRRALPLACLLLFVPLALWRRRGIFLAALLLAIAAAGVSSCMKSGIKNNGSGGAGGGSGTPAGTYYIPITVTAEDPTTLVSTGITQSLTATLNVD